MTKTEYTDKNGNNNDLSSKLADILTEDQYRGFCKGNAIKLVLEYQDNNGAEDLIEAITYLEKLKEFEWAKSHDLVEEALRTNGGENPEKDSADDSISEVEAFLDFLNSALSEGEDHE
jgi:hypothetical protein